MNSSPIDKNVYDDLPVSDPDNAPMGTNTGNEPNNSPVFDIQEFIEAKKDWIKNFIGTKNLAEEVPEFAGTKKDAVKEIAEAKEPDLKKIRGIKEEKKEIKNFIEGKKEDINRVNGTHKHDIPEFTGNRKQLIKQFIDTHKQDIEAFIEAKESEIKKFGAALKEHEEIQQFIDKEFVGSEKKRITAFIDAGENDMLKFVITQKKKKHIKGFTAPNKKDISKFIVTGSKGIANNTEGKELQKFISASEDHIQKFIRTQKEDLKDYMEEKEADMKKIGGVLLELIKANKTDITDFINVQKELIKAFTEVKEPGIKNADCINKEITGIQETSGVNNTGLKELTEEREDDRKKFDSSLQEIMELNKKEITDLIETQKKVLKELIESDKISRRDPVITQSQSNPGHPKDQPVPKPLHTAPVVKISDQAMGKDILLAEDDSLLRKSLAYYLGDNGYTVVQVTDGVEAIEEINKRRFDLMIIDLKMPHVGGLEVIDVVRRGLELTTPVIVLTASGVEEVELKSFTIGATDFISKPFSPSVLKARVDKLLGKLSDYN